MIRKNIVKALTLILICMVLTLGAAIFAALAGYLFAGEGNPWQTFWFTLVAGTFFELGGFLLYFWKERKEEKPIRPRKKTAKRNDNSSQTIPQ